MENKRFSIAEGFKTAYQKVAGCIARMSTRSLWGLSTFIGFSVMIFGIIIFKGFVSRLFFCLGIFIMGTGGIGIIVRQEDPVFKFIPGWLAIIDGLLYVAMLWGVAIFLMLSAH